MWEFIKFSWGLAMHALLVTFEYVVVFLVAIYRSIVGATYALFVAVAFVFLVKLIFLGHNPYIVVTNIAPGVATIEFVMGVD